MSPSQSVFITLEPFILASASPRRSELLHSVGLVFEVAPSQAEEHGVQGESPSLAALRWAGQKAKMVADRYPNGWVLAADTIVVLGDRILGKPRDPQEAAIMLGTLSGCVHDVITGICLV
ncbi:MAG: Maf family protein, partial [Desulfoferrobacter sp.]